MNKSQHIEGSTYTGPERRNRTRERYLCDDINKRFADGVENMKEMRAELEQNTAATQRTQAAVQQVQADTEELVQWLKSLKGAFAVFDVIGRAAKPLTFIVGACTAVWVFFQTVKGGGPAK